MVLPWNNGGILRRSLAFVLGLLVLAGCAADPEVPSQFTRSSQAAVISDEPKAALVGRDILALGGNPVDAAVAMALSLTVTLPSRAGLLGGGSCLVHDPVAKTVTDFDFRPFALPRADGSRSEYGAPGLLRGLFAMQARYGSLRFEQLVIPAERLARFDGVVSRSLYQDMQQFGSRLARADNPLWHDAGKVAVGDRLPWEAQAGAFAVLRQEGLGSFYGGRMGRQVATALGLDPQALAATQPVITEASYAPHGADRLYMAGGEAERGLLEALADGQQPASALIGDAPPATAILVKGKGDFTVACAFTQGLAFGAGEPVTEFGLWPSRAVAAELPASDGFLGPVMMANSNVGELRLAAAVTGSDTLAQPLVDGMASVFAGQEASAGLVGSIVGGQAQSAGVRRSLVSCTLATERKRDRICGAALEPGVPGLAITP